MPKPLYNRVKLSASFEESLRRNDTRNRGIPGIGFLWEHENEYSRMVLLSPVHDQGCCCA